MSSCRRAGPKLLKQAIDRTAQHIAEGGRRGKVPSWIGRKEYFEEERLRLAVMKRLAFWVGGED